MKANACFTTFLAIVLLNLSHQATLKDNKQSILDLLNSLDKEKIIEIGNRIQRDSQLKDVDFSELLKNELSPESASNQKKSFSFQNVLQQASGLVNSNIANNAANTLINNAVNSVSNIANNAVNSLVNSNSGNVDQNAVNQLISVIGQLNGKNQSPKGAALLHLLEIAKQISVNNQDDQSSVLQNLIANLTNGDPQLQAILQGLPDLIQMANIDPTFLASLVANLTYNETELTSGIINAIAGQTNLDPNAFQSNFDIVSQVADNLSNLNMTALYNAFGSMQDPMLDPTNLNNYINIVANQTGLSPDQIRAILVFINQLGMLGPNFSAIQVVDLTVKFLNENPSLAWSIIQFVSAVSNVPTDQIQNVLSILPSILNAASSGNSTQLYSLIIAQLNNLPIDQSTQLLVQSIFQFINQTVNSGLTNQQLSGIIMQLPSFFNFANSNSTVSMQSQAFLLLNYLINLNQPNANATMFDPNLIPNLVGNYSDLLAAASTMSPQAFLNYLSTASNNVFNSYAATQLQQLIGAISPSLSDSIQSITDVKQLIAILVQQAEQSLNSQLISLGIPIPSGSSSNPFNQIDPAVAGNIQSLASAGLNQLLPEQRKPPGAPANNLNFL